MSKKRISAESKSLQDVFPELAAQWHPTKNGDLTPDQITSQSNKKVWWKCIRGHEWSAIVCDRSRGNGCPYCAGRRVLPETSLAACNPVLAAQWHPEKNGELTPDQVTAFAHRKVWWLCEKEHAWKAAISNRSNGNNCPYCAGQWVLPGENDLETLYPDVAKEWHPTKNLGLTPDQVMPKSMKKIWWQCENGHEWQDTLNHRTSGRVCPYCAGQKVLPGDNYLATLRPDVAREWHPTKNNALAPDQVTVRSSKKVWWLCKKGHEWQATIYNRTLGDGCPYCSGRYARAVSVHINERS